MVTNEIGLKVSRFADKRIPKQLKGTEVGRAP